MSGGRPADILPLSPAQEGLLYHALLDGDGPDVYLVQARFLVDAEADTEALRGAVQSLLARHPNLRACFRHKGLDRPVQLVPHRAAVPWAEADLSGLDAEQAEAELRRLLAADRARRFDVTRPPLVRCTLVRRGPHPAELVLTLHHLLVDGWSMPIVARELAAFHQGRAGELPPAPPYRDYLAWLHGQDRTAAAEAWRSALDGLQRPTLLAPEHARRQPVLPQAVEVELTTELTAALRARARASGVTLNTLAQAAWGLVLARTTGSDDVVFGAVVSGRPPELPGVESMVGLFLNTLPVRVRLRPGEPVGGLLARLQEEQLRLTPHHHVRLAEVQRLTGADELFDTVLAFENYPRDQQAATGRTGLRLVRVDDATHYPLTLTAVAGDRLWLRLGHRPDCLGHAEAELVAARLVRALELLAADPDTPADRLDVLPEQERRLVLGDEATARPPVGRSLPGRFAAQAARTPHATAVECAGRSLSYAELAAASAGLARRLTDAGAGPEAAVALLLDRSAEQVIAQLAVARTGACYLPLDPGHPPERLARLLRDAGARLLVTDRPRAGLPDGVRTVPVAGPYGAPAPVPDIHPDAAAYVMYTSGSTGAPKGVVTTHRNVLELAADRCFDPGAHARVLLHSPYTFDAATYEVWVPLLNGGTVVVAPPGPLGPDTLKAVLTEGRITALWLTAELFRTVAELAPDVLAGLREVWAGGDVLAPEAVRSVQQACPRTTVVNGYGPTETTTFATRHPVPRPAPAGPLPIGRPLDNSRAQVLDAGLRPVPVGAVGELYLTGTGLARGYLGQPARTAERFVAAPYAGRPGERMYRTGDLARRRADGTLEFAGRADDQVKIRGFRIEPGEVEAVLEGCPGVTRAVVAARPDPSGGRRLLAWLVLEPDGDLDTVRDHAARHLPAHLLPAAYQRLDRVPLTAHGKVDRSALPQPPAPGPATATTRAPRTPREQRLCELFAEALGVPAVGPDDGFFESGGHSLLAMRLVAAVEAALGTRLPISALYQAPTPAALAARLDAAAPDLGLEPLLTLRAEGDRTPLICVHPGMGLGWTYAVLLRHLAPGRPVHALQSPVLTGRAPLPESIGRLAEEYLPRILAVQPDGPYLLLGRSFGGLLAHQLAALLHREGRQVGLLAVLDAVPTSLLDTPPGPFDHDYAEQEALDILLRNGAPGAPVPTGRLTREGVLDAVRGADGPLRGAGDRTLNALVDVCTRHSRLAREHHPDRFDGRMLLFSATAQPGGLTSEAKAAAWRRATAEVRVHDLDCAHSDVLRPGPVAEIAAVLEPILREC